MLGRLQLAARWGLRRTLATAAGGGCPGVRLAPTVAAVEFPAAATHGTQVLPVFESEPSARYGPLAPGRSWADTDLIFSNLVYTKSFTGAAATTVDVVGPCDSTVFVGLGKPAELDLSALREVRWLRWPPLTCLVIAEFPRSPLFCQPQISPPVGQPAGPPLAPLSATARGRYGICPLQRGVLYLYHYKLMALPPSFLFVVIGGVVCWHQAGAAVVKAKAKHHGDRLAVNFGSLALTAEGMLLRDTPTTSAKARARSPTTATAPTCSPSKSSAAAAAAAT